MLKTVKDACSAHPSTLDYQFLSGVECLFQTINAEDRAQGNKLRRIFRKVVNE